MVPETLGLDTLVTGDIALVLGPGALCVTDTLPACPPTQHYPVLTGPTAIIPVAKMGSGTQGRFALRGVCMRKWGILFVRILWAGVRNLAVLYSWLTIARKVGPAV